MAEPRFLTSKRHRAALWYAQNGTCAKCGELLPTDWHADHTTPWHIRATTNLHEMTALCPSCNLTKGGKVLPASKKLRPWQQEAASAFSNISRSNAKILIDVVPGGGKGSLPYILAAHVDPTVIHAVCHAVPRLNLRDQAGTVPSWLREYLMSNGLSIPIIRAADNEVDPRRGHNGYSISYQSIFADPDLHRREFDRDSFALFLDEPQLIMEQGAWANRMQPLVDRAAALIMMSGTFYRSDRARIPWLPYVKTEDGEVVDFDHPDWTTIRYSRRDALRDRAILRVDFKYFDAKASLLKGSDSLEFSSFSELGKDKQEQRSALYAVLNDKGGVEIADNMLCDWRKHRGTNPTAQALIITHSQASARVYISHIQKNYPTIDVKLAISEETTSSKILRDFRRGVGDVLVTVGMAYIGMDAERISHIALLTYIRQMSFIVQAISRGVRINSQASAGSWESQYCWVYVPDDPLLKPIIKFIEEEQVLAIVEREEGPPPPPTEKEDIIVFNSGLNGNTRAHELNIVSLTTELTGLCDQVITSQGLNISAIQLFEATNAFMGVAPMTYQPSAPEVGEREREDSMKKALQKTCSTIDAKRGLPWGTTNGIMIRKFNKGRPDMSFRELVAAKTWLVQTYGEQAIF